MSTRVCPNCGTAQEKGAAICPQCGAKISGWGELSPAYVSGTKYEPVSTWGFVGMQLLMLIPIVNIILLIVWACGGTRKVNRRNWARGQLLIALIAILLLTALIALCFHFYSIQFADVYNTIRPMH